MRLFELHRDVDSSGVSGTGIVAQGVEFDNGQCAMSWLSQWQSVAIYSDITTLEAIHGHSGNTRVVWLEDERSYTIETWENGPVAKVVDKLDP
jgi:hypothetical protein